MQVESALLFETPEQIFQRVFRQLRPRSPLPAFKIEFCPFANANSFVRLRDGVIHVRMTDILQGAPAPILESLAFILLAKLFRRAVPKIFAQRYRRYFNRKEMRRTLHLVRQARGRKFVSGPQGRHYHLGEIFAELNQRFFHGLMAQPLLGWSRRPSRTTLGHFDPSHNAIIISSFLDRPEVPRLAVEYVLFHEILHLRFPAVHTAGARQVHTAEFRRAEQQFPNLGEAKELLKKL